MSEKRRRCAICKRCLEAGAPLAPFCSERCRLIDLGNWLGEGYRIPEDTAPDEERGEDA